INIGNNFERRAPNQSLDAAGARVVFTAINESERDVNLGRAYALDPERNAYGQTQAFRTAICALRIDGERFAALLNRNLVMLRRRGIPMISGRQFEVDRDHAITLSRLAGSRKALN